ncbi:unnamed protein product [Rhizophagus irregularis]|nr:unnamed protein product [Rhizophagus irregularis]
MEVKIMMDFRVSLNVEPVSSLFKSLWIWDIGFFKVFFDVRILTKRVFVSLDIADHGYRCFFLKFKVNRSSRASMRELRI